VVIVVVIKCVSCSWNRVGLVLDKGIEEELLYRHLQCADAARATLGIAVTDFIVTEQALHIETFLTEDGNSSGTIQGLEQLAQASQKLIQERVGALLLLIYGK
jgi:hypothetical protein